MTRHRVLCLLAVVLAMTACTDAPDTPAPSPGEPTPSASAPSPTAAPSPTRAPVPAEADGCPPPVEQRAPLPAAADEPVTTTTVRISESPSGRPIDVTTLVVDGAAGARITADLQARVDALVTSWDQAAAGASADQPEPELGFEVRPVRTDAIVTSVVLDGYEYLGGASGNAITGAVTYATATGAPLALDDVGLGGDCLDELGALVAEDLVARDTGLFDEAEAALRAGEVAMDQWSVHDDGTLRIHLPPYEVAPGAAGAVTATVDLEDLRVVTGTALGELSS